MSNPPTDRSTGHGPTRDLTRRLSAVVESEARRMFTDAQLAPDPARVAQGWERRFIADAARAREAMELYEQLGYEVSADPVEAREVSDDCSDCWLVSNLRFVTIYTRRRARDQ